MTEPSIINRIAVILVPTEACLDWINSCDDDKMTLDEIQREPTVFLLPEGKESQKAKFAAITRRCSRKNSIPGTPIRPCGRKTFRSRCSRSSSRSRCPSMVFDLGQGNDCQGRGLSHDKAKESRPTPQNVRHHEGNVGASVPQPRRGPFLGSPPRCLVLRQCGLERMRRTRPRPEGYRSAWETIEAENPNSGTN